MIGGVTLCFDTVVSGGDIAICRDEKVLALRFGDGKTSSSETLLTGISELLEKTSVQRNEISCVALIIGPGSYTGIRIGIATALGLSASIGCYLRGVSSLEILAEAGADQKSVVSGVWAGRNAIAYQEVSTIKPNDVALMGTENFISEYADRDCEVILDHKSYKSVETLMAPANFRTLPSGENVARLILDFVSQNPWNEEANNKLSPIYSRSLFDG